MSKAAIFWLSLLFAGNLFAQDTFTAPWKSVKLYLNSDWENSTGGLSKASSTSSFIGLFTPAFSWSRQPRIVHEIEIPVLQFEANDRREVYQPVDSNIFEFGYIGGWATTNYLVGLRYELAWKWLDWGPGAFYFGGSLAPFASKTTFTSDIPGQYDLSEKAAGVNVQGVFRLLFRLNHRWFVDLNAPAGYVLNTLDTTVTKNGVTDQSTAFNFSLAASMRVGLGFRL